MNLDEIKQEIDRLNNEIGGPEKDDEQRPSELVKLIRTCYTKIQIWANYADEFDDPMGRLHDDLLELAALSMKIRASIQRRNDNGEK